jgi:hypothetical protein
VALDYEDFPVQLALAGAQPVVTFGLVWAGAYQYAYGPKPLGVVLVVAGGVALLTGFVLEVPLLVHLLAIVALWFAVSGVFGGVIGHAMQERGVVVGCTVLDVKTRVETRTYPNENGTSSTSETTYYDHELLCADAPVHTMTLASPAAEKGERLDVAYDPEGRLDPSPAGYSATSGGTAVIGWIALAAAFAVRVAAVLVEHVPRMRW